jgi:LPXTG-motif cell wall-anchored protein
LKVVTFSVVALAVVVSQGSADAAITDYVALGDSYASGVGTNHYDLSSSCDRSSYAYPPLVAAADGYTLNFQACTGATTTDVINDQVAALSASTDLVTVTAGGDDAGFADLLVTCSLDNCVSAINSTITWVNASLAAKLDAMDEEIRTRAPNALVIVLGYPHLSSGTCADAFGISAAEVTASNHLADAMDNVTRTEAERYGFTYGSAIAHFANHGVCASKPWLHGAVFDTIGESYHPTRTGYSSGYASLVRTATGTEVPTTPTTEVSTTSTQVSTTTSTLPVTTTSAPGSAPLTTVTATGAVSLPRTGSNSTFPVTLGLCSLVVGALLMLRRRPIRSNERAQP